MSTTPKYLAVFDYDHTVVDDNTDLVARALINPGLIPDTVRELHKSSGWIEYMQEIFKLLHKHAITRQEILDGIRTIKETPGMTECFKKLSENQFEIIIISDSNSVFIDTWNQGRLSEYISKVFTNPARFDENELLCIRPYHHQTYCTLSSENLCKGQIMEDFIAERKDQGITYNSIYYIGDGRNDICPMLRLGENDFACPRVGYSCEREIENVARRVQKELKAEMYRWNTGEDLLEYILGNVREASEAEAQQ